MQANAFVLPVTTHDKVLDTKDQRGVLVPRIPPVILGTRHLVIKHAGLRAPGVTFRDDAHLERTRRSYACESAFYRDANRAPGPRGGDLGDGGAPFAYLVEGDETSDAFTFVMEDVRRAKPGAVEKVRAEPRRRSGWRGRRRRRRRRVAEAKRKRAETEKLARRGNKQAKRDMEEIRAREEREGARERNVARGGRGGRGPGRDEGR